MNPLNSILNEHYPDNQVIAEKTIEEQISLIKLWGHKSMAESKVPKYKFMDPNYLTKNDLWDSTWLMKKYPRGFGKKRRD